MSCIRVVTDESTQRVLTKLDVRADLGMLQKVLSYALPIAESDCIGVDHGHTCALVGCAVDSEICVQGGRTSSLRPSE